MDIPLTDPTQVSEERGASRVFLLPADKVQNNLKESTDTSLEDRLSLALRSASTEKLKASLSVQIAELNEDAVIRVGAELTSRGIAPCFRDIPIDDEWLRVHWSGVEPLLLLLDLQWIVARYPNHEPEWQRLKSIFDPKKFGQTVEYLHWGGKRSAGQAAKAMGLSEQQQLECVWTQCLAVERWLKRLNKRLPIAQSKIEAAIRNTDKRPISDQDETIKRRTNLWLCAELAKWKPQRTSEIYLMKTGETMSRSLVANQLAKLPKVRRGDEVIALERLSGEENLPL